MKMPENSLYSYVFCAVNIDLVIPLIFNNNFLFIPRLASFSDVQILNRNKCQTKTN